MLWRSCLAAVVLLFQHSTVNSGDETSGDRTIEPVRGKETIVKASEFNLDLLLRFKIPEESIASKQNPVRIEAEIIRGKAQGPFMLKGFVLLPMQQQLVSQLDDQPSKKHKDAQKYVKLPFGKMDIVAPLKANKPFLLFPYEDAEAVRKRVQAGDVVLVGVEAIALSANKAGNLERVDIDIKVRRLLSW